VELAGRRLNRRTAVALAIAAAVATAVLVAALSVHSNGESSVVISTPYGSSTVAQPQATFVQENGGKSLVLAAFPLFASLLVTAALWLRSPAKKGPGPYAVTTSALLVLECVAGILTIGVFVLPTAALVLFACATFTEFRLGPARRTQIDAPTNPERDRR